MMLMENFQKAERDPKNYVDQCKVEFIFMYLYPCMHVLLQSRTVLKYFLLSHVKLITS